MDAFGHDLTLQCWTAVSRPWQARAVVRSSSEVTSSSRCLECAYPDSGIFSRGAAREREQKKKKVKTATPFFILCGTETSIVRDLRRQHWLIQRDIFTCCLLQLAGPVFQRGGKVGVTGDDGLPGILKAKTQGVELWDAQALTPPRTLQCCEPGSCGQGGRLSKQVAAAVSVHATSPSAPHIPSL